MGYYEECINCKKRTMGCHSTCESYIRSKEAQTKENELKRQKKTVSGEYIQYANSKANRLKKRYGR